MKSNNTVYCIARAATTLLFLMIIAASPASAQGFFKQYFEGQQGFRVEILPDAYRIRSYGNTLPDIKGYLLTTDLTGTPTDTIVIKSPADTYSWFEDGSYIHILSDTIMRKYDAAENILWEVSPVPFDNNSPIVDRDGSTLFYGDYPDSANNTVIYAQKYGPDGTLLWTYNGTAPSNTQFEAGLLLDGGAFGYTFLNSSAPKRLIKLDEDGQLVFDVPYTGTVTDNVWWRQWANGPITIYGYGPGPGHRDEIIEFWSNAGQLIRTVSLDAAIPQSLNVSLEYSYTLTANGDIVFVGTDQGPFTPPIGRSFLARLDSTGTPRWIRYLDELGFPDHSLSIYTIEESPDGDLLMTGTHASKWPPPNIAYWCFWKTDSAGIYRANSFGGLMAHDTNVDCLADPNEPALKNRILRVKGPDQQSYFTQSGQDGYYLNPADSGTYTITSLPINYLWEACDTQQVVVVPADTANFQAVADFPYQALADCPLMTVSLATPHLNYCDTTTYHIQYCNQGTTLAANATVEIEMAANVSFAGSAQSFSQTGQTVVFTLGDVSPGDCGLFQFEVVPGCDSTVVEQTLCLTAYIYPDTICNTPPMIWSGGGIEVRGACAGDSVRFLVKNIGYAPTSELDFIIADDHVIMYNGQIPPLNPGAIKTYGAPANGHTWRFMAEQEPNFPGAADPSVAVEACTQGIAFSTGYVNQFPNSTGSPFAAMDCRRFYLFPDSTLLSAQPTGAGNLHLINATAPIEYLVYFVNTDTVAVTSVTIVDTLPAALNAGTADPGAASTPYSWSVTGANVLSIQRQMPLGPGQSGFVSFKIEQQPGNAPGTLIENTAVVVFDQQPAKVTNTVWHTVAPQALFPVSTSQPKATVRQLSVYPNPANRVIFVQTASSAPTTLRLRNALGGLVFEKTNSEPVARLERNGLPAGVYYLEAWTNGHLSGVGKVVWKK